jgi:arylsulfatase A-like enzyme
VVPTMHSHAAVVASNSTPVVTRGLRLSGALAALMALSLAGCSHGWEKQRRPNVILITFDTMRADFLGCYGDLITRTPNLDALAARGVLFEWAFTAAPFTPPAIWSLLFSEHVHNHTYGMSIKDQYGAAGSLAERFRRAGYRTLAVVGTSQLKHGLGFERGFDRYLDTWDEPYFHNETTLARVLALAEEEFGSTGTPQPYFLYVHFFDPHTPWGDAPPAFRTYPPEKGRFAEVAHAHGIFRRPNETAIELQDAAVREYSGARDTGELKRTGGYEELLPAMYRSEITWSDDVLGRLLEAFRRRGLLANTEVAVSSDHGIAFAEHYQTTGYVFSLFPETLHVPLLVVGPSLKPRRISAPVSLVDLGPTLLDLAGIASHHAEGRSFLPLVRGGNELHAVYAEATAMPADMRFVIFRDNLSRYAPGVANSHATLIAGTHQIIYMPARHGAQFELYDYRTDPKERINLFSPNDPVAHDLARLLLHRRHPAEVGAPRPIDPEVTERLRALGYVK